MNRAKEDYAAAKGYQVCKEVTEIASGLNDQYPKLEKLLADAVKIQRHTPLQGAANPFDWLAALRNLFPDSLEEVYLLW
jgi:hypothetical protein